MSTRLVTLAVPIISGLVLAPIRALPVTLFAPLSFKSDGLNDVTDGVYPTEAVGSRGRSSRVLFGHPPWSENYD